MSPKIKQKYNKKVITHATLWQNKLSLILIMYLFIEHIEYKRLQNDSAPKRTTLTNRLVLQLFI